MKRQDKDQKKIYANHISDKMFVYRLYKELSKHNYNIFLKFYF